MLTRQRKQLILEKLGAEGQVQSKALSILFDVSEDTIRRDLRELAAEGRLQRVHGGALPSSSAIAPFAERQSVKMDAKKRVARTGAQLISSGQVVIIDGGTTTSELITFFPPDLRITVVTHSPSIALGLVDHPAIEVILIGGRLYKHSIVAVGAAAIEGIENIHADLFFMGVTGIHPDAGLTTGDFEEASIKRAFSGRAAETVVLASPEKINTASSFVIGDVSSVNTIIVEDGTDKEWIRAVSEKGVSVVLASDRDSL
ncbi:DeoR/GlpR family DNA-binding transcription regulator [Enterobacter roggenkampii]|uniref:DeoR/GlpR family DNA-binding transcription regulator n=1 Tax=Enterobacter roggenkampii TaxID=1812935 RepID=UPI00107EC5D0|nr:DeoR/GlpR family DNA-binding transcription regulator [Enterobacter roggenkampii]QBX87611.1 DeoR/GlpR transcriptional regulator [Enterobacter roggenkampii]UWI99315.1 DeoR/GlpR family DNA-binding transcription regulator [Enterobacter roggenkampii]